MLTALTVAAVVCIASSNGGTTSQDLKTGFLIGATPRPQQYAILVGALTSAVVIGGTMLALDYVGTHYTRRGLPENVHLTIPEHAPKSQVGRPYSDTDTNSYFVVHIRKEDADKVKKDQGVEPKKGRYLVDDQGRPQYWTDTPIAQESRKMDRYGEVAKGFAAPQPQLFTSIIEGILGGTLEWGLFGIGALIAIAMELAGVRALPFAVGMYLPISVSVPIFAGGMLRWVADKIRGVSGSEAESETSPGVLLSSGFIAGGTVCGLIVAFFAVLPDQFNRVIDAGRLLGESQVFQTDTAKIKEMNKSVAIEMEKGKLAEAKAEDADARAKAADETQTAIDSIHRDFWLESGAAKMLSLIAFGILAVILFWQGLQRPPRDVPESPQPPPE
jgi:hypothetical protein